MLRSFLTAILMISTISISSAFAADDSDQRGRRAQYVKPATKHVLLKVRIGEVSRSYINGLGNDPMTLGRRDLTQKIDWLNQNGLFKMYAEPTIVAMDGEKAEFTSGGEYPVPNNSSVSYEDFGVKVSFTPTVIDRGLIKLDIDTSVSEPRGDGAIKIGGSLVPSMVTHSAKTKIELAPGSSYMIAGLVKNNLAADRTKHGKTIFADLFAQNNIQKEASEIVIIVTPYFVTGMSAGTNAALPTDKFEEVQELDNLFKNTAIQSSKPIRGNVGYMAD
jgi:pilus assembly protein CpaC